MFIIDSSFAAANALLTFSHTPRAIQSSANRAFDQPTEPWISILQAQRMDKLLLAFANFMLPTWSAPYATRT